MDYFERPDIARLPTEKTIPAKLVSLSVFQRCEIEHPK
jgi:hypothetical protein